MSWEDTENTETDGENVNALFDDIPEPSPVEAAQARVAEAAEAMENGPELIAAALDELRDQVSAYRGAYSLLDSLDAATGARRPATLPGVRAVDAAAKKKRGRPKAA